MIVTVTMNPAIDKTASIEALHPHALNRLGRVEQDVGGKGINVSKMLATLGRQSIACGFVAGQAGRLVVDTLYAWPGGRITPDFVSLSGETRTNLKLVEPDGSLTELNESGPAATPEQLETLTRKLLDHAGPGTLFVLAGSIGPGVPQDIYRTLTARLRATGSRVLVDADGPLFARAVEACPDVVKPNAYELCQYFGVETTEDTDALIAMGMTLTGRGVGLVCISMGGKGACFVSEQQAWFAPALPVAPRSTVGAGDAMLAGVACGLDRNLPRQDCLRLGMAASAAACTTSGTRPPEPGVTEQLLVKVNLINRR